MIVEQVIFVGSVVAGALVLAIIVMSIAYREVLLSEGARLRVKENLGKLRVVVLLGIMSLYLYILGGIAEIGVDLNILPANYHSIHDVAEIAHLGLFIIAFTIGLQILSAMKGDSP